MIDPDKEHEPLFSSATLKLGEIHWYVMRATTLMESLVSVRTKGDGEGGLVQVYRATTQFAKEVGRDEINWWVSKKKQNLEDLRRQTEPAREAAQSLMRAADQLRWNQFDFYPELLESLKQFAEQHTREIDIILAYVRWLAARDILAPIILFTYRVWGSTRRSDRWIDVAKIEIGQEDPRLFRRLAEAVLGLHTGLLYAVDRAEYEIGSDIAAGMDDDMMRPIEIPFTSVVLQASHKIFDECAVYFRELRNSLTNILLDIDKFLDEQGLIHSDAFWREFVLKAARVKKAEPQLWGFKRTLTMWVAQGAAKEEGKVTFTEDCRQSGERGGWRLGDWCQRRPRDCWHRRRST
jgi:hypothetical protein